MDKFYKKPMVIDNDIVFEGVFADSGDNPPSDWSWTATWTNHNSGSHSDLSWDGSKHGQYPGNYLKLTFKLNNSPYKITAVGGSSATVAYWNEDTIVVTRDDSFNANEGGVQVSVNNIVFDSPEGAYYYGPDRSNHIGEPIPFTVTVEWS